MKFQLVIIAAAMAIALPAQTASAPPAKAPTGYTDTPLIPGSTWRVHDDARPRPPLKFTWHGRLARESFQSSMASHPWQSVTWGCRDQSIDVKCQ